MASICSKQGEPDQNLVPMEAWAHCPGALNPADTPSRGTSLSSLLGESRWLNGPAWLSEAEKLQEDSITSDVPNECLQEMKKTSKIVTLFSNNLPFTKPIFDCERYSSFQRLLRVTAIIFKFIYALKSKVKHCNDDSCHELVLKTSVKPQCIGLNSHSAL